MISRLIRTESAGNSYSQSVPTTPTPTFAPTLKTMSSPSPAPSPAPSSCPAMPVTPIPIPEYVAEAIRNGNFYTWANWITAFDELPYIYMTTDDLYALQTLCNSPGYSTDATNVRFWLQDFSCQQYVTLSYVGTSPPSPTPTTTPTTSIPGVTIPPETKPLPGLPELPIIPEFIPVVRAPLQKVIAEVAPIIEQQKAQIEGQLDERFDAVAGLVNKIPGKISDQLINVMGQTYGVGVSVGFDVPTMEEIQSGTVNFNPPSPSPSPTIPDFIPTLPNPGSCPVPIVNVAPVCPSPPQLQDITFSPIINVNVPAPGMPAPITPITPVTVNVPAPVVITPPSQDTYINVDVPEPTPTPTPSPTPTPDDQKMTSPAPEDKEAEPCPPVPVIPAFAPLAIPRFVNKAKPTNWEFGAACSIPANPGGYDEALLWDLFGWKKIAEKVYEPPNWLQPANWPLFTQSFASMLMNAYGLVVSQLNLASSAANPILNNFPDFITLAGAGIAEKWLGAPILPFLQGTIYNINYNNPQLLPGIPDLQGLFRKGAISEEVFRCLVRANGSYDSWQMKVAESSTLVPSLFDIIRLYRGKKIGGNEFEYYANLNGLKISTPQGKTDIATFLEATRAIPGVSDLVRMMVRDAADNDIAAKYGTDTDLGNKFAGKLKEWSEQQGVDPEIMKYFWRAHWEIPSNTQLFDMLHKLRPNRRVGVVPANIVTTSADVRQAIQVNDLTPYWVDRVMATSYSILTRIDAQRAFFIEAIDEDRLFDAYMDLGYNSENAQTLVDFTKELKRKRDAGLPGADKPANIISQLKKYVINEATAYNRLIAGGMKKEKAKKAVENSVRDRKEEARARCLKEAQRRFFRAEYDLLKYKSVVMQLGIPQENIEALVNETACLYDSRGKELNAGALCKAFKQNIIAADQFTNRLQLIGYNPDEAYVIAESCQIDKVVAIGKAKLQKEAKEKAEAEKAKKAEEKAQKDAEKKAEKAKKAKEAEEKKKEKEKKEAVSADETTPPA